MYGAFDITRSEEPNAIFITDIHTWNGAGKRMHSVCGGCPRFNLGVQGSCPKHIEFSPGNEPELSLAPVRITFLMDLRSQPICRTSRSSSARLIVPPPSGPIKPHDSRTTIADIVFAPWIASYSLDISAERPHTLLQPTGRPVCGSHFHCNSF